jgi:hypothetical protein
LLLTAYRLAALVKINHATGQLVVFTPTLRRLGIRIGSLTKHPG